MELDGEGAANFEQLKEQICKECDKLIDALPHSNKNTSN